MADLYEETARGGRHYLPMSQSKLESLDQRPDFFLRFSMDDHQWNVGDASAILNAYTNQMFTTTGDRRLCAWEETKWVPRVSVVESFNFRVSLD